MHYSKNVYCCLFCLNSTIMEVLPTFVELWLEQWTCATYHVFINRFRVEQFSDEVGHVANTCFAELLNPETFEDGQTEVGPRALKLPWADECHFMATCFLYRKKIFTTDTVQLVTTNHSSFTAIYDNSLWKHALPDRGWLPFRFCLQQLPRIPWNERTQMSLAPQKTARGLSTQGLQPRFHLLFSFKCYLQRTYSSLCHTLVFILFRLMRWSAQVRWAELMNAVCIIKKSKSMIFNSTGQRISA